MAKMGWRKQRVERRATLILGRTGAPLKHFAQCELFVAAR
jgi:hypothetical protein